MNDEIQKLRQEIAELRVQIENIDNWANGVFLALQSVLPHLLRDHPEVEKVQTVLKQAHDRYDDLRRAEPLASDSAPPELYEASKMLYRLLALVGVWPNVDPLQTAQETIERARK